MPSFVPVTYEKHSEIRITLPPEGLVEFTNISLLPIYDLEIPQLAVSFPLVFASEAEGYTLSLLCSLSGDMPNAWIDHDGKWVGRYLPAIIRQRPFTSLVNDKDELELCIDEDSPLIADEGTPLFKNESPTKYLETAREFLPALYGSGNRTGRVMRLLQGLDLITSWEVQCSKQDNTSFKVEGLFRIDEDKLKQLNDEDWLSLRDQGAMPIIYGQLFSMANLQTLANNLESKINYTKDLKISQESFNFALGGDGDTLNFDDM